MTKKKIGSLIDEVAEETIEEIIEETTLVKHLILKNFAFGNPVIQYTKGEVRPLDGDCAEFAIKAEASKVV